MVRKGAVRQEIQPDPQHPVRSRLLTAATTDRVTVVGYSLRERPQRRPDLLQRVALLEEADSTLQFGSAFTRAVREVNRS